MRLGPWEIGLIVIAIVILFGAKRIPELMRGLGSGIREFKAGMRGEEPPPSETPPASSSNNQENLKNK